MTVAIPRSSSPRSSRLSPSSTIAAFAAAIDAADLDAASECISRDACLITPDTTTVRGRDSIRPLLQQMISIGTSIRPRIDQLVVAGELALCRGRWQTRLADPAGTAYRTTSTATFVLRKVEPDFWKLQILAPWERG